MLSTYTCFLSKYLEGFVVKVVLTESAVVKIEAFAFNLEVS